MTPPAASPKARMPRPVIRPRDNSWYGTTTIATRRTISGNHATVDCRAIRSPSGNPAKAADSVTGARLVGAGPTGIVTAQQDWHRDDGHVWRSTSWLLSRPIHCRSENPTYGVDHQLWLLDWDIVPALVGGHETGTGNGV